MLKKGTFIDSTDRHGDTVLHYANYAENNVEMAKLLFEKGANPYIEDDRGASAFSLAKSKNDQELIELFEAYNSNNKVSH